MEVLVSIPRVAIDKALAAQKLRVVNMADVVATEDVLVKAMLEVGVPGNECRVVARRVLALLIEKGEQYGEGVEASGERSLNGSGGTTESTN